MGNPSKGEEMTVVSLAPWLPAAPKRKHHPVIDGAKHISQRAFPPPDDEPEGRLLAALTMLVDAEGLSELEPSSPWWMRLAG